jgi:hypothetical protein
MGEVRLELPQTTKVADIPYGEYFRWGLGKDNLYFRVPTYFENQCVQCWNVEQGRAVWFNTSLKVLYPLVEPKERNRWKHPHGADDE